MSNLAHSPLRVRVPRGLLILTGCWVFASWAFLFGLRPPIQPQAASYGPSVQLFFTLLAVGISVAWPLFRLSGAPLPPLRQSLFDAAVIGTVMQLILWPARLLTLWSVDRTGLLDIGLCGVLLATASILTIGLATQSPTRRAAWMILFVALSILPTPIASNPDAAEPFFPCFPNASLVYAIAQSAPTVPSDALREATREALASAALLFCGAIVVVFVRNWRARSLNGSTCPLRKVV